jgi:hypothetical protein
MASLVLDMIPLDLTPTIREFIEGIPFREDTIHSDYGAAEITGFRSEPSRGLHGIVRMTYNGVVVYKAMFRFGVREGITKEFHEDGTLKKIVMFKADQLEGRCLEWYEDGCISRDSWYKNGRLSGKTVMFEYNKRLLLIQSHAPTAFDLHTEANGATRKFTEIYKGKGMGHCRGWYDKH